MYANYFFLQVRVIDAINPGDPALKVVASGGVTTSLILPGSGNLMGLYQGIMDDDIDPGTDSIQC